jgi:quercetin dioxygenase-like cupin family protein
VADPILVPPGGGERFERDNRAITILAELPGLSALIIEFEPSFEVEPHWHDDHVDAFYVLEGEVEFTVGSEKRRAGAGTYVAAPPGSLHGFANPGSERARILNLHAPDAGFAASIRGHKP